MRHRLTAFFWTGLIAAAFAAPAQASVGYELDASKPSRTLAGPPRGIAINQATQDIYVAIVSLNPATGAPGEINRFNSDLTADGVFGTSGLYTGVAVDPISQSFFASQIKYDGPFGSIGTPKIELFSSAGALSGSFAVPDAGSFPPLGTDSTGRVFYPDSDGHAIRVYNSAGVLQNTITCSGCPGGAFGRPLSLALDAADNLYVADLSPSRVVKLTPSGGGSYSFASLIQNGGEAVGVGVDPATGDVLVGNLVNGRNYHVVAYNSAGVQFDDFGAGIFPDPPQDPPGAATNLGYQMAVNATTHKLYVGADNKFYVFEKTTIDPPTATANPATEIGQIGATLNASVNANGHAALECEFEYTLGADVGFASATNVPCPLLPTGSGSTSLALKAASLSPQTAYRFRVTTTTNAGSVTSSSQTFETLPEVPPTVTAESPTEVAQTTATIRSKANPHGGVASDCHFELGTSTAYGSSFTCPLPGSVTTDIAIARKISGLTAGTTYHYRLVVTTNAGTTEGPDVSFTTATPPPPDPEPEVPTTPPATPPAATAPPSTPPPTTSPKPKRCKKGFHRRKVRGKVKCVRKKRGHKRRRHRQLDLMP